LKRLPTKIPLVLRIANNCSQTKYRCDPHRENRKFIELSRQAKYIYAALNVYG